MLDKFLTILLGCLLLSCSPEIKADEPVPPIRAAVSETLPVLYIETIDRQPITSKTEYVEGTYWLDTMGFDMEPLGNAENPQPLQIRGRGHSSWKGEKKPYKLKLGEKTSIMGMPKNKHWALLKPTENTIAGFELGRIMGMAWTPDFRPVEVVLNGDYIGLYFLTETIRIGKNRVNIFEQQDLETDPTVIPGGWLVEVDNYHDECQITIPECSRWNLTLRYHSPEVLSAPQLDWLTNEFKTITKAIYSTDKTSTEWEEHIDVDAMARFFILQEVMDNPDGFHGSFYLHKDSGADAKWVAGPVWDLSCYNREKTDYTFKMKVHYSITPHWIGELIQYDNFCKMVKDIWEDVYPAKLEEIYARIDELTLPLECAWQNDAQRWNDNSGQTANLRANRIKEALSRNIQWFNSHLPVSQYASSMSISVLSPDDKLHVVNMQGIPLGDFNTFNEVSNSLSQGIYVINGQKVVIK